MSKIFITGCNGLIGSFIAKKLLKAGHTLTALKRRHSDLSELAEVQGAIQWYEGDILDVNSLADAMQGADYVIHTAAVVSFHERDWEIMKKVNIEGTANVVNIALQKGIQKFIHVSSIAAIGATQGVVLNEKTAWDKSEVPSVYAQTKFLAEVEVWRGVAEGLKACIVNPSVVLGTGNWTKSSNQYFNYVATEPTFYPSGYLNCIDVRDVADIVEQLLFQPIENERFILTAHKIPHKDFLQRIATLLGKKPPHKEAQLWHLYLAYYLSKLRQWFTGKPNPLSHEIISNSQRNTQYDNTKIQKTLNFTFRPLEDTLQWTAEYYKQKYLS
jgi:nucleoside-diphosphate-sugar epimerase